MSQAFRTAFLALVVVTCTACGALSPRPGPSNVAASYGAEGNERLILVTLADDGFRRVEALGPGTSAYRSRGLYVASPAVRRIADHLEDAHRLRRVSQWPIRTLGVVCIVYDVRSDRPMEEILAHVANDQRVESVQAMNTFRSLTSRYNDPYLSLQHGIEEMQIEQAHRWATGRGVSVAIVDTGVDSEHPDLVGHIEASHSFVPEPPSSSAEFMHGTAVTGVIASTPNNGLGIVGVAPDVRLVILRACWAGASAAGNAACNSFTLAQALDVAIQQEVNIINLSLTGPRDPLLERLIRKAMDKEVLIVAAIRDGPAEEPGFPAAMHGVIAVRTAERATSDGEGAELAWLSAPGIDVLTTIPQGGYDFLSGSSLAAAHVSGVAALILERDPNLSASEVLELLLATSGAGPDHEQLGAGSVNANAALRVLRNREVRIVGF